MKKRVTTYQKGIDPGPIICGPDPVEYKSLPAKRKEKKSSLKYQGNQSDNLYPLPEGFLIQ
jgi:hypothetical protein